MVRTGPVDPPVEALHVPHGAALYQRAPDMAGQTKCRGWPRMSSW